MALPDPKPFASLSSGLLARKGQARPAMRPQGFVGMTPETLDDLGWNDMGDAHAVPAPTGLTPAPMPASEPPEAPPVLRERERLNEQFDSTDHAPSALQPKASATEPKSSVSLNTAKRLRKETAKKRGKAAFTLRLDTDRHLRLRLASAVRGDSAQALVTEALDRFLEQLPQVDALVRQLDGARDQ